MAQPQAVGLDPGVARLPYRSTRGIVASSASAVAALLGALACCLPTGALLAALGFAGFSAFQPYLLAFAALALLTGAVLAARARQCPPGRRRLNLLVLALSAAFVLPALLFPAKTAAFLADSLLSRPRPPAGQAPLEKLDVASLRERFNQAAGSRRVIALFSPT
jgi:hypothetical protein